MKRIENSEVLENMREFPKWVFENNFIKRSFKFKNFKQAFSFMTAVAFEAEGLNHHPNWDNVYNTVNVALQTHDVQGISSLDFDLAKRIDEIAVSF